MTLAITGGTGFIGTHLVEYALSQGRQVILLARDKSKAERLFPPVFFPKVTCVTYDPYQMGEWVQALAGCEAVVNLAGASIAGRRWTRAVKAEIRRSRVETTKVLVQALQTLDQPPPVLVNASAIGFYGSDANKTFDEYSFAGNGFLADVCQGWEQAVDVGLPSTVRAVKVRIGVVLGYGGALARILPIFQAGAGGVIGSGKQWFSWIHRSDLVRLILWSIDNPAIKGVVNGTAPQPVTNAEFTTALAQVLGRPAFLPVPALALQVLLGESASVILEGQRVIPQKAQLNGFQFLYPDIVSALQEIIGKSA
jgi:uncharacterized protein (TIGR01777 family)